MKLPLFLVTLISIVCINCTKSSETDDSSSEPLFQLLAPEKTRINFQNHIEEGINTNILMYEYFYNGGGVAIGDVNNDGLEDIYFTSNMEGNKLYLNRGKMEFDDITPQAGVSGRQAPWKTGATMADVNGDGLLDIFVCYSGSVQPQNRLKQLFINQGNDAKGIPTFIDKATEYGIENVSTTTQAAFFDYDKDGDLDLFLLNHNIRSLPVLNLASTADLLKQDDEVSGMRLYRHDKSPSGSPYFVDITQKANLLSSPLSYGLGIGIADFNQDGWQDMYISNDYGVPDFLYINNQKGGFTNEIGRYLNYFSQFSMGNDVSDINNDGKIDIFTLDMLPEDNRRQKLLMAPDNYEKFNFNVEVGFGKQYMRNMLHLNNPNGQFSEIGQLAGISNTDWSWAALFADYDNDGWKDLYITNGYLRDYTNLDFLKYMNDFTAQNRENFGREQVLELVKKMPSSNLTNYVFRNNGDLTFQNKVTQWGITQPANSNGAAYADLDNDGDLDLVVNNINQPAFIYQNQANGKNNFLRLKLQGEAQNSYGIGAKVTLFNQGKIQFQEMMPTHGYQSSVSNILHFGTGKSATIDSIQVAWLSGKTEMLKGIKANQLLTLSEKNAKTIPAKTITKKPSFEEINAINFTHRKDSLNDFKRQSLLTNPLSAMGPCLAKADINNDGLEDVFVGGATQQAGAIFIQNKNGSFSEKKQPIFEGDKDSYDTDAVFFDANNDNFLDLYVCSGGYGNYEPTDARLQDRLYLNDGKGNFSKGTLPQMLVSSGCVAANDFNKDGKTDIFVGGRVIPGRYPETPTSYLLQNNGNGQFSIKTPNELKQIGMVTDAAWYDLNGDKTNELILVGEMMPITVLKVDNQGVMNVTNQYFEKKYTGFWNRLHIEDLNADGKPELIVGNLGINSQLKASDKEPIEIYYKDFDKNGSVEPILTTYIQGKSYPYLTRDELLEQLPMFRAKFTDYKSYAEATLTDVFKADELAEAGHLTANCLKTMYFESTTSGKFKESKLPIEAQFSPIFTITTFDVDNDGLKDVFLGGNMTKARLKMGDYEANKGFILRNTGNGKLEFYKSLNLNEDMRSSLIINDLLIVGMNQNRVKVIKTKK